MKSNNEAYPLLESPEKKRDEILENNTLGCLIWFVLFFVVATLAAFLDRVDAAPMLFVLTVIFMWIILLGGGWVIAQVILTFYADIVYEEEKKKREWRVDEERRRQKAEQRQEQQRKEAEQRQREYHKIVSQLFSQEGDLQRNKEFQRLLNGQTVLARSDHQQLEQAYHIRQQAEEVFHKVAARSAQKGYPKFMQEERAYLRDLFTCDTIKKFVLDRKWNEFQDVTNAILKDLQFLAEADEIPSEQSAIPLDLRQTIATEFENKGSYTSAARVLARLEKYYEAGIVYEKDQKYRDAVHMYEMAFQRFQQQHNLLQATLEAQIDFYTAYLAQNPQDYWARYAFAKVCLRKHEWEEAFQHLQVIIDATQPVLRGKALIARAQCCLGRAEGADVMLGLQDINTALEQYRETLSPDKLLDIAYQLNDTQYLQATGTQVRFPQQYQQILDLVTTEAERNYTELYEEQRLSQSGLFEHSDEVKDTFPQLSRAILVNMVTIFQKRLQKMEIFDPNMVFDVALELRERELHDLVITLFKGMITAYAKLFQSGKLIESAKLFSLAKRFQEYNYEAFAEQLMQTMVQGYQSQFERGATIDLLLMLSLVAELQEMEFNRLANDLVEEIITSCNERLIASSSQHSEQELLGFARQLWQNGYHQAAKELIDGIGTSYQHKISKNVKIAQEVMDIAEEFWKRAQEQPDIRIFDQIAERMWHSAVTALEGALPLENLTKENLEHYYSLFKAYQAVREPVKCNDVGLKILGVVGIQGYKDVRQIVDNLVTSGFQAQQWQATSDSQVSQEVFIVQPTPRMDKAEQFGEYTGTYFTKGGMGEIYKGTAPNGELVAIKRIPRYSLRGKRRERFLREIELLQSIDHPNIVKILAFDEQEGYYVMEWAEHGTLEDVLKKQKTLPVTPSLELTLEMAKALEAVHQQGIIHRDIKPSNILMFSNNQFKLTDFGIARAEQSETLTGTGAQVGTLRYMSPEQFMAEEIDNKTDIFSLGLVLYEMIVGDIPFANPRELCQKDIEEILEHRHLQLPETVKVIISRSLRNNANRRYDATELKTVIVHAVQEI